MTNPKQLEADVRVPLHLCPPILEIRVAAVMRAAVNKPGRFEYNYRYNPTSLKTYINAARRHLAALEDGEWMDEDMGEPHAAAVAANMAIILDCDLNGNLQRDLPEGTGKIAGVLKQYQERYKAELNQRHPGVVQFEDGKDCGDPDCKASKCLQRRVERMSQSDMARQGLDPKCERCGLLNSQEPSVRERYLCGVYCNDCFNKREEVARAKIPTSVKEELQCENCMLLQHEDATVCIRSIGEAFCSTCWQDYLKKCPCDASGVSPTTPCRGVGCPRWKGNEPKSVKPEIPFDPYKEITCYGTEDFGGSDF